MRVVVRRGGAKSPHRALEMTRCQGWTTIRALGRQLMDEKAGAAASAILPARKVVMATVRALDCPATGSASPAEHANLSSHLASIEDLLASDELPCASKVHLARFYCLVTELAFLLPLDRTRTGPTEYRDRAGDLALPLTIPSALLYQTRRLLLPAERMAVGAVRRSPQGSVLEAVFDVTGRASRGHVDADPDRLMRAFIDIDNAGAVYAFWAHTQPGVGASATYPSDEDRETFRRRLSAGDSPAMVAAILSETHVRFLRADMRQDMVGAGSAIEIVGSGFSPFAERDATGSAIDVYEFAS